MTSILALLARPLIQAAISAFGHVALDFMKAFMADRKAQALGRADAQREAAIAAAKAQMAIEDTPEPEDAELIKRLRNGAA